MKQRVMYFCICFCFFSCSFFDYLKSHNEYEHRNTEIAYKDVSIKKQVCSTKDYPWPQYQYDAQHTGLSPHRGPIKGKLLFERDFKGSTPFLTSGTFISGDKQGKNLYFADGDTLFIFNVDNRKIKQKKYPVYDQAGALMLIFDHKENAYFTPANKLYRYQNAVFKEFWHSNEYVDYMSFPVIDCDDTIYVVLELTFGAKVCSIPKESAEWCTALPGKNVPKYAVPAVGRNGEIYVVTDGKMGESVGSYLTALDPSGKIKWKVNTDYEYSIEAAPMVGPEGDIYFGVRGGSNSKNTYFYAISSNGKTKWNYKIEGANAIRSAAAISPDGKTIYFVASNHYLYALTTFRGELKWRYYPVSSHLRSASVVDNAGTIYFADHQQLVAVSPFGKKIWQYLRKPSLDSVFSNPIITQDGTLYILYQRTMYAFRD